MTLHSRRNLTKGIAWAMPAIVVAAPAPALAVSAAPPCSVVVGIAPAFCANYSCYTLVILNDQSVVVATFDLDSQSCAEAQQVVSPELPDGQYRLVTANLQYEPTPITSRCDGTCPVNIFVIAEFSLPNDCGALLRYTGSSACSSA